MFSFEAVHMLKVKQAGNAKMFTYREMRYGWNVSSSTTNERLGADVPSGVRKDQCARGIFCRTLRM